MATELTWWVVVDNTSAGIKYPNDWFRRMGYDYKASDCPLPETIGRYLSEDLAIKRLKKWAIDKGIDFEQNTTMFNGEAISYEDDWTITCHPVCETGIYYGLCDNQIPRGDGFNIGYQTSAVVIRKTMTMDED